MLFNAPELSRCGFGQLDFTDASAQPFVLILPFLPTSIPAGAPRVELLQDEPKASGSANVVSRERSCSVGCPRLSGSRNPGSWADVPTEIEASCWQRQPGFGLAHSD